MKRKWIKRSDVIILAMTVLWFVTAIWGMIIATVQVFMGSYSVSVGDVMMFVGTPFAGAVVAWFIKNMSESNTKNKLNPDYLKQEEDEQ